MPVSRDLVAVAGEVEDLSTNFPFVLQRTCKMIGSIYRILGIELMHAGQAIDLRARTTDSLQLGKLTKQLYEKYRERVAFIEEDRHLSTDFENSYQFLSCQLIYEDCIFKERK